MESFSRRLRQLRGDTRQADMAKMLGVSLQSYSAFENGREPSYAILVKLAEYFDVSTDYILGRSEIFHIDNYDVANIIGLNDESIDRLKCWKDSDFSPILNFILPLGEFSAFLDYTSELVHYNGIEELYTIEENVENLLSPELAKQVNELVKFVENSGGMPEILQKKAVDSIAKCINKYLQHIADEEIKDANDRITSRILNNRQTIQTVE